MKNIKQFANSNSVIQAIKSQDLNKLVEMILSNPLARVDRVDFLSKLYGFSKDDVRNGSYTFSLDEKKQFAKKRINSIVKKSSGLSFASGLPGGFAVAGTVPADILQNLVFSIRLIQELAYIYDYEDLIEQDGEVQADGLILFLGTMFNTEGAASLLRVSSKHAEQYAAQQQTATRSTRNFWYPFIKSISQAVASKAFKRKGLASAASKLLPIIGGAASGGLTAFTTKSSAGRLNKELIKGCGSNYQEKTYEKDIKTIEAEFKEIKKDNELNP